MTTVANVTAEERHQLSLKRRFSGAPVHVPAPVPAPVPEPVPSVPSVRKTAVEKANEAAAATAANWAARPAIDEPLYGPGSGGFDLLNNLRTVKLGTPKSTASFQRVSALRSAGRRLLTGPKRFLAAPASTAVLCAKVTRMKRPR